MENPRPLVVTGQQIGAGWTPALSVVKALAAQVEAGRLGGEAVFWMADEDHDALEVAATVGLEGPRLKHHRFRFPAPEGTATGWLPWTFRQQEEAEALWGEVPQALEPTLRAHFLACGAPLWSRGLRAYSPTDPGVREGIQGELERWRGLDLEADLVRQAEQLRMARLALPLDPRVQGSWFALDPRSGARRRLEPGDACPAGQWLSPGAALRPLMQQLLLPATAAVVLGPAERAYWRLTEPLWERVGLAAPRIVPRPTVFVRPRGAALDSGALDSLRRGEWGAFAAASRLPSASLSLAPDATGQWSESLQTRARQELERTQVRLARLDRRLLRDLAARRLGMDPERLRQALFPFGKAQERVLPGLFWLRDGALLDRMEAALGSGEGILMVEGA